jgi:hypothetical protein
LSFHQCPEVQHEAAVRVHEAAYVASVVAPQILWFEQTLSFTCMVQNKNIYREKLKAASVIDN